MITPPRRNTCTRCSQDVSDTGTVCWPCAHAGIRDLDTIATWSPDLEVTLTRQDRIARRGGPAGHRTDDAPLPLNTHASNIHTTLHRTLTTWTRRATTALNLGRGTTPAWPLCHDAVTTWCVHASCRAVILDPGTATPTTRHMARLLADNMAWARRQNGAADLLNTIARAAASIPTAIDLPPAMRALGKCDTCGTDLRAPTDAVTFACRCGHTYDVKRRLAALYARVDTILHTAPVLARTLTDLMSGGDRDLELDPDTIGKWARRGRLARRGSDPHTRQPRYRFGDVRALYTQMINRKLKAKAKAKKETTAA